ncbi:MAG TPA: hypothetical protein VFS20_00150 [Longimicrobium sp.]|nr:hypothetical protein [Longimicrobium sp.]
MLSIQHPNLLPHLERLGYGLCPVFMPRAQRFFLVLKANKEAILTARVNNGFKIYLLGEDSSSTTHLGFVTAFFDDHDEPLVVVSPQYTGDDLLRDISLLLGQDQFDVYFFDEHNRELMGVQVINTDAERFRQEIAAATFPTFDSAEVQTTVDRLKRRFGSRDHLDDANAFAITFAERLYPDDSVLIDARDEAYQFQDAQSHVALTSLERQDPGPFQERDIAVMLGRVFSAECIYLNPFRSDTGKELTDVLVVTDNVILCIQAKDSPNTEAALRRTLMRKRLAIRAHIEKATKQLAGALTYLAAHEDIVIRTKTGTATLVVSGRQLWGIVVVHEMFDDDYITCSAPVLNLVNRLHLPAILTDYAGLMSFRRICGLRLVF